MIQLCIIIYTIPPSVKLKTEVLLEQQLHY